MGAPQVCVQTLVGSCTSWPPYYSSVACLLWQENCNLQFTNSLSELLCFILVFLNDLMRRTPFQSMAEFLDPYYAEYSRWYFQIFWLLEFKELWDGISLIISSECCKMCPSSQTNPPVKRTSVLSNALPKCHEKAKWHQTDASGKCWLISYQGDALTIN